MCVVETPRRGVSTGIGMIERYGLDHYLKCGNCDRDDLALCEHRGDFDGAGGDFEFGGGGYDVTRRVGGV